MISEQGILNILIPTIKIRSGKFAGLTIPNRGEITLAYKDDLLLAFHVRCMNEAHVMVGNAVYHIDQFEQAVLARVSAITIMPEVG
jgi:hypothetical protein